MKRPSRSHPSHEAVDQTRFGLDIRFGLRRQADDDVLVKLRSSGRTLGGSLTWEYRSMAPPDEELPTLFSCRN